MGIQKDYPIDFDNQDGLAIMNSVMVGSIDMEHLPLDGWWMRRIAALCEKLAERNQLSLTEEKR